MDDRKLADDNDVVEADQCNNNSNGLAKPSPSTNNGVMVSSTTKYRKHHKKRANATTQEVTTKSSGRVSIVAADDDGEDVEKPTKRQKLSSEHWYVETVVFVCSIAVVLVYCIRIYSSLEFC